MKSTIGDYVRSSLWIGLVLLGALAVTYAFRGQTRSLLGPYHVLADLALGLLSFGLLMAMLVRLLVRVRPIPAGTHSLDSAVFAHWKVLTVLYRLGQGALRPFVPFFLQPVLDGLFGARIGGDVAFGGTIDDPYAVTVGNRVILGHHSLVSGNYLWDGALTTGAVRIDDGATIGAHVIVFPGVHIGAGASVMNGAVVMPGTVIPVGEVWRGNPARRWSSKAMSPVDLG